MKCPNCNTENPRDARFCSECGASLPQEQAQTRMAETQKAAGAALALGNAARQARMEAYVEPGAIISTRAYNAVMIGVVLWGLLVNVLLCTYVGDVYRYINPVAFLILYLVLAFGGIFIASKSDNAAISFLGYNMVVVPLGLAISAMVAEYGGIDSQVVKDAFLYTLVVTLAMLGIEMMFPAFFEKLGMALLGCLIALMLCEVVLLLFHVRQNVTDWIASGLFSVYIAYDIHRSQQFPKTLDNAVDCALDIYLDMANLFLRLLRILGSKNNNNK